jgi:hypothetical protein
MRNRYMIFLCLFTLFFVQKCYCQDRRPSAPYVSGDTFRSFADFIFDETNRSFSPEHVAPGSIVFVKTDYLEDFFKFFHPRILFSYILISHNSDHAITSKFEYILEDEKLIAWFGQNVENYSHPKLHPIPIGIANRYIGHGNTAILDEVKGRLKHFTKDVFVYMNFALGNYPLERSAVYELFIKESFCLNSSFKDFYSYLLDLARSKFILSPRGNGIDCHRMWEALYMGAYPIVKSSSLDPLYEGLPVIIVNDWNEVTENFLVQKYEEMKGKEFAWEKINADYWFKWINGFRVIF